MNTIHKYQFNIADTVTICMPLGAKVLSIQVQNEVPTIWAFVETDFPFEDRKFRIYGTGHPIESNVSQHIGTIQLRGFVWHVFE